MSFGLLAEPLQFWIVLALVGGAAATADNLMTIVRRLPPGCSGQIIAIGRANLDLTAIALVLGGNARVGMEDTKGEQTRGNGPLVARTLALDRPVASVAETEARLSRPLCRPPEGDPSMNFDEIARLLDPAPLPLETGLKRLPDGVLHVAVRTDMHGCTGEMSEWWFRWRCDTQTYIWWHPVDHVSSDWGSTLRADTHVGSEHIVAEYFTGQRRG